MAGAHNRYRELIEGAAKLGGPSAWTHTRASQQQQRATASAPHMGGADAASRPVPFDWRHRSTTASPPPATRTHERMASLLSPPLLQRSTSWPRSSSSGHAKESASAAARHRGVGGGSSPPSTSLTWRSRPSPGLFSTTNASSAPSATYVRRYEATAPSDSAVVNASRGRRGYTTGSVPNTTTTTTTNAFHATTAVSSPGANQSQSANDNVMVVVRVRPLLLKEAKRHQLSIVEVDPPSTLKITRLADRSNPYLRSGKGARYNYSFDAAFGPDCTQEQVWRETAAPLVDTIMDGTNATIFVYGATGMPSAACRFVNDPGARLVVLWWVVDLEYPSPHSLTHTHTHRHMQIHTQAHTHTHIRARTQTFSHTHTHTYMHERTDAYRDGQDLHHDGQR
jgi:hypothetical protein